ncbi:hypothetical protein CBP31_08535 [Oceanisphaera profunda]|uniref:DUF5666 domain-containing protein n=1 Tax=Oceanisphaera profunda TaxID=1416627 RepID=A0A1Y0D552_9GAMM|nr:hypothetical protein [Oceanisphaera profunda]ART82660.1 hypothetical protein CBP31_08535 [Oceanisphaera profunda]
MNKSKWVISAAALVLAASANAGFGGNHSYNHSYNNGYTNVEVSKDVTTGPNGSVSFDKTITKANGEIVTISKDIQRGQNGSVTVNKNVNGRQHSYTKNFNR